MAAVTERGETSCSCHSWESGQLGVLLAFSSPGQTDWQDRQGVPLLSPRPAVTPVCHHSWHLQVTGHCSHQAFCPFGCEWFSSFSFIGKSAALPGAHHHPGDPLGSMSFLKHLCSGLGENPSGNMCTAFSWHAEPLSRLQDLLLCWFVPALNFAADRLRIPEIFLLSVQWARNARAH